MRPSEDVIVTVTLGREQVDMELPAFLSVHDLKEKMCGMLRAIRPDLVLDAGEMALLDGERTLPEDKCLASCGIWDGSVITCGKKSEVDK